MSLTKCVKPLTKYVNMFTIIVSLLDLLSINNYLCNMKIKNYDYEQSLELNHNEVAAKVNVETGEVKVIKKRKGEVPTGYELFEPDAKFKKSFPPAWKYLGEVLNPMEFKVAFTLMLRAYGYTNSLEPLNDDTTNVQLKQEFDISINNIPKVFNKLKSLGVMAQFSIGEITGYKRYWILNPYLSFSGVLIKSDIANLFKDTYVTKAYHNPKYQINLNN